MRQVSRGTGDQVIRDITYIGSLYEIEDGKVKKHIFAGSNKVCTIEPDHTYYTHSDHLGSSNVITDETGTKLSQTEYQPYGQVSDQTGPDLTPYKFTGKELDSTGLYYYGARYYDPEIGRFITADSIIQASFDPQTFNRYTYCRNNPLKYVDPSGHFFWMIIIGAILGGISVAINDQPVWQGILLGAAGGALIGGGAFAASSIIGQSWAIAGAMVGGAASGAGNAAVAGGNIGFGALVGGIGAGIGFGLGGWASGWGSGSFWGGLGAAVVAGGAGGALGAALAGGDVGKGAYTGAAYAAVGFLAHKGVSKFNRNAPKSEEPVESDIKQKADDGQNQAALDTGRTAGGDEGRIKAAETVVDQNTKPEVSNQSSTSNESSSSNKIGDFILNELGIDPTTPTDNPQLVTLSVVVAQRTRIINTIKSDIIKAVNFLKSVNNKFGPDAAANFIIEHDPITVFKNSFKLNYGEP